MSLRGQRKLKYFTVDIFKSMKLYQKNQGDSPKKKKKSVEKIINVVVQI